MALKTISRRMPVSAERVRGPKPAIVNLVAAQPVGGAEPADLGLNLVLLRF